MGKKAHISKPFSPKTSHYSEVPWKKTNLPTHCRLVNVPCLNGESVALLEQIKTIDKRRIMQFLGRLDRMQMAKIDRCVEVSLGLTIPKEIEAP